MKSCRRKNEYFVRLLRKYRSLNTSSPERPTYFARMKECAKTFWEWSWVYQIGGDYTRTVALDEMKNTFLDERCSQAIQMNILEMFEIVTDEDEREEILAEFFKSYQDKDSLLFVAAMASGDFACDALMKVAHYYSSEGYAIQAVVYKENRIERMRLSSSFMKNLSYRY